MSGAQCLVLGSSLRSGLLSTAVSTRQYSAVQAYVALIAVAFVLFNAFVDGVYSVLDPRIRHARVAAA